MERKTDDELIIIAHRGASAYEPENTMASFKKALELGCHGIEFDIRMSLDRELVVMHDSTVKRTTDGKGRVGDMTLEELKELDAGNGERVPTAKEVFSEFSGKTHFVVEIKEKDTEEKLLDLVYEHKMLKNVYIVSFSKRILRKVKVLDPEIKTGLIKFYPTNVIRDCERCNVEKIAVFRTFINKKLVNLTREKNLNLFAWVVNRKDQALKLKKLGIKGIVTDRPDIMG